MHTINTNTSLQSISHSINMEFSFQHLQNLLSMNQKVQYHVLNSNKRGKNIYKDLKNIGIGEMEKIFNISLLEDFKRLNAIFNSILQL